MLLSFPASITPDGDGFLVLFPDIPEAVTCGDTYEEALQMASDAIVTAMDFFLEDQRPVPQPSRPSQNQVLIDLSESLSERVFQLNETLTSRARNAGTVPQNL